MPNTNGDPYAPRQDRRRRPLRSPTPSSPTIKQGQDLATSSINAWVDLAGKTFTMPSLDSLPIAFPVANPREVVEVSFGFAEELLATQKELATKLVDAVAPKTTQTA